MYEQDPSIRQIAQFLRGLIFSIAPELKESVKRSNPSYEKQGNVAYISATDADVTVGFFNQVIVCQDTFEKSRSLRIKSLEDVDVPQQLPFKKPSEWMLWNIANIHLNLLCCIFQRSSMPKLPLVAF